MYVIQTYKNMMIGVENSDEGQIVDYDRMIRIIYMQQLNAQIDIIYLPSQKTTLTSALLGTFWRALSPPQPTSIFPNVRLHVTYSQVFQKVESGWGPIFKVVLEC